MTTEELLRLRMRNSFNPADPFAANLKRNIPLATPSPLNPPDTGLSNLRALKTPALDEYRSYLSRAPKREDYQLSGIGKALAAISGFGEGMRGGAARAYETSSAIMDEPYRRATEDYNTQGGRLKEKADLEYRGLTDQQKLEVQLAEHNLKLRDQIIKEIKAGSDIKVNDAQIKNLMSQAEGRNIEFKPNETTGQLEAVNKVTGARMSLGQFMQTPEAKEALRFKFFQKEEGVRQQGRRELQNDAQSFSVELEKLRQGNAESLARLRSQLSRGDEKFKKQLEGMTPSAQKTAFELAFQQATLDNPELQEDDPVKFMDAVRQRLKEVRERSTTNKPTITENETISAPTVPTVETDPMRIQAVEFLKSIDADETDEENITNAIAKLQEEAANATPQVSLAPNLNFSTGPEVNWSDINLPSLPAGTRNTYPIAAGRRMVPAPLNPLMRRQLGLLGSGNLDW